MFNLIKCNIDLNYFFFLDKMTRKAGNNSTKSLFIFIVHFENDFHFCRIISKIVYYRNKNRIEIHTIDFILFLQ